MPYTPPHLYLILIKCYLNVNAKNYGLSKRVTVTQLKKNQWILIKLEEEKAIFACVLESNYAQ